MFDKQRAVAAVAGAAAAAAAAAIATGSAPAAEAAATAAASLTATVSAGVKSARRGVDDRSQASSEAESSDESSSSAATDDGNPAAAATTQIGRAARKRVRKASSIPQGVTTSMTKLRDYKRNLLPTLEVDTSWAVASLQRGKARCTACVLGRPEHEFNAKKQSVKAHAASDMHQASVAAAALQPAVDVRSAPDASADAARRHLREVFSAFVTSRGHPLTVMDTLVPAVVQASTLSRGLHKRTQAREDVIGVAHQAREIIKQRIRDKPLTLLMDGGDSKFGDGMRGKTSVYNIFAFSAYLPKPLLLQTNMLRDEASTAIALGELLKRVVADYDLAKGNIIAVCTDNAANAKKSASVAGLRSLPCVSHTLDLVIDAFVNEFRLDELLAGLNSLAAPLSGLHAALKAAGLPPNKLQSAEYKFHYAADVIAFLCTDGKWDALVALVRDHKPRGVADLEAAEARAAAAATKAAAAARKKPASARAAAAAVSAGVSESKTADTGSDVQDSDDERDTMRRDRLCRYRALCKLLQDPLTKPRVFLYARMTRDAVTLIRQAEGNASALPHDFFARLKAYNEWLEHIHDAADTGKTRAFVDRIVDDRCTGTALSEAQRLELKANVECAIEAGHPKLKHLDDVVPLLRRRESWHPRNEPPTGFDDIMEAAGRFVDDLEGFDAEANRYREAWKRNKWAAWTTARDHAGCAGGDFDLEAADAATGATIPHVDPIAFWNQEDLQRDFPSVRKCAMYYLSVPLSTACVERSFSIMRFMEQPHKLAKKDEMVEAEMFLRCNADIVDEMLAGAKADVIDRDPAAAAACARFVGATK